MFNLIDSSQVIVLIDMKTIWFQHKYNFILLKMIKVAIVFTSKLQSPFVTSFAVEVEGEIVGFILFEIDEEVLKIWRFLIDKKFQNKGYAKEVLKLVIEMAKADKTFYKILADYVNGNDKMKRLLMNMGFKESRYREDINEFETLYYIER